VSIIIKNRVPGIVILFRVSVDCFTRPEFIFCLALPFGCCFGYQQLPVQTFPFGTGHIPGRKPFVAASRVQVYHDGMNSPAPGFRAVSGIVVFSKCRQIMPNQ